MKKQVAFITTIYNSNLYLNEFFSSFKGLNKELYEIIVVDDCSEENPSQIIKSWEKDIPIKYIKNKKNMGIAFSRNAGLKIVNENSSHVVYIDADDAIIYDKLFENIFIGKITYFNEYIWTKTKLTYHDMNKNFGKNSFHGSMSGRALPTNIAKEFPHDESIKYYEDMLISRRIEKKYKDKIILSNVGLIKYRQRKSSITNTAMSLEKFSDMHNQWEKMLSENLIGYTYAKYELRQRYWIWHKSLKGFPLSDARLWIRVLAFMGGNIVRILGLKKIIYNKKIKNLFE